MGFYSKYFFFKITDFLGTLVFKQDSVLKKPLSAFSRLQKIILLLTYVPSSRFTKLEISREDEKLIFKERLKTPIFRNLAAANFTSFKPINLYKTASIVSKLGFNLIGKNYSAAFKTLSNIHFYTVTYLLLTTFKKKGTPHNFKSFFLFKFSIFHINVVRGVYPRFYSPRYVKGKFLVHNMVKPVVNAPQEIKKFCKFTVINGLVGTFNKQKNGKRLIFFFWKTLATYLNKNLKTTIKRAQNTAVIYKPSSFDLFINEDHHFTQKILFLRKTKIFNKSRYSRNRQLYRTGVFWCIWLSILLGYGFYFLFYRFTLNFNYLWWFFFFFINSFFLNKIVKYRFYNITILTGEVRKLFFLFGSIFRDLGKTNGFFSWPHFVDRYYFCFKVTDYKN